MTVVDVFERGTQAQLGLPQTGLQPAVMAFGHLAVD
jgi:hypothetical protein